MLPVLVAALSGAPAGGAPSALASWDAPPLPTISRALPSVPCIAFLTMENDTSIAEAQPMLSQLGLWDNRTTVLWGRPDLRGGKAKGVWDAHVRAWSHSLERGCSSTLVFEDDVSAWTTLLHTPLHASGLNLPTPRDRPGPSPHLTAGPRSLTHLVPGSRRSGRLRQARVRADEEHCRSLPGERDAV